MAAVRRENPSWDSGGRTDRKGNSSMTEEPTRQDYWEGTPLQMVLGLEPYGIEEIVIEFDTGDEEVLKPRMREEYGSYELWQAATYLDSLSRQLGG
jgi:hypothetical protein